LCLGRDSDDPGCLAQSYKTGRKIGRGSMSVVYSGLRRADGVKVALKTMQSSQPEVTRRAEEEYELLRRLRHPYIVSAWELAYVRGHAMLVLERCEGSSLSEAVRESPEGLLGEAACSALSAALAAAVEYLHASEVVHCDLEPGNVMISRDLRRLKLLDFGSALRLCDSGTEYVAPCSGDSVLCLAPEVVLGEQPSIFSDIWQLGLCMYFMLSGDLPQGRDRCRAARGSVRSVAATHVSLSGPAWRETAPAAKSVLRRCLVIDRLQRPTTTVLLNEASWLQPAQQADADGGKTDPAGWRHEHRSSALLAGLEPLRSEVSEDCTRSSSTISAGTSPSTGRSFRSSHVFTPSPLPEEPYSEVVVLGDENERATLLLINYAERTYKVRFRDGRIKVVRAEDVGNV